MTNLDCISLWCLAESFGQSESEEGEHFEVQASVSRLVVASCLAGWERTIEFCFVRSEAGISTQWKRHARDRYGRTSRLQPLFRDDGCACVSFICVTVR